MVLKGRIQTLVIVWFKGCVVFQTDTGRFRTKDQKGFFRFSMDSLGSGLSYYRISWCKDGV